MSGQDRRVVVYVETVLDVTVPFYQKTSKAGGVLEVDNIRFLTRTKGFYFTRSLTLT